MNSKSRKINKALLCAMVAVAMVLSGCSGVHLYRQDQARLAQSAKKIFSEKVDLLAIVATERANLVKQRDAELAAIRQSQVYERDLVFFNAARLVGDERFLVLRMPDSEAACNKPLTLRYVARRSCELKAGTSAKLNTLANAAGNIYRSRIRNELIAENRADLQTLGWTEAPKCDAISSTGAPPEIAKSMSDALKTTKVEPKDYSTANDFLVEVITNCQALARFDKNLADSGGLADDTRQLKTLQQQQAEIADEGKRVAATLKDIEDRLKKIVEGETKAGETRKSIAEAAKKLREKIDKGDNVLKTLGAQEALADLQLDAATVLLQALEGEQIPDNNLKGEDGKDLRRAVVVAQTMPQLADDMRMIDGLLTAPSKSSLLIAQRQALIDKENVAAKKAQLEKRVDLVRRRISLIVEEARLLQLASAHTSESDCKLAIERDQLKDKVSADELSIAVKECGRSPASRLLLGYNFLSRSMLVARAGQEATRWEDAYLRYEQNIVAKEYALNSWNNLVGTPIVLLEGYHTGGIKAEALGDLILKAGGLGLLGIAVKKSD